MLWLCKFDASDDIIDDVNGLCCFSIKKKTITVTKEQKWLPDASLFSRIEGKRGKEQKKLRIKNKNSNGNIFEVY